MKHIKKILLLVLFVAKYQAAPQTGPFVISADLSKDLRKDLSKDLSHVTNKISDKETHNPAPKSLESKVLNAEELTNEYWLNESKKFLEEQISRVENTKKAKNIIMFLGDGLSHPSIAAARVYLGGEEKKLSFEEFPFTANSKTYCVNKQVADSACTSTAYLSGVKGMGSTIGLNANATRKNCADSMDPNKFTESIASWAQKAGKSTGIVTTTRVTHASPAGIYAHVSYRHWESDSRVRSDKCDSDIVDDVTEQLVYSDVGKNLKVILGGGSRYFLNNTFYEHNYRGSRTDGKNLIEEWKDLTPNRKYVNNRKDLLDIDPTTAGQVLGIFDESHCRYNLDVQRDNLQEEKPSLTDMTSKAIDILNQNPEGYFLFVEGGRIDHGHHDTAAKYAIDETAQFSKAIEATIAKINTDDTLVVVTADHGHVMSIAGYAPRGNDIFGFAGNGDDEIPYMTLSYANGLGYYDHWKETEGRVDATTLDRTANDFRFPSTLPRSEESHGGEDVGIWAVGPWAHLFQGTIEQHVIPHIMAYASCLGNGLKMCDNLNNS